MSRMTRRIRKAWRMCEGKSVEDRVKIFFDLITGKIKIDVKGDKE